MEGGGDCINIKVYFHYFPQLLLSFRRKGKKSLCAVKHANGGAGRNRQAQYYLDFIFRSLMLSYLSLFSPFLPFIPYFNGRGVLADCDCLIDISCWRRYMEEETGAEDEEHSVVRRDKELCVSVG